MAKILLVDDSPSIRLALRELLWDAGHDVDCAADGVAGLAALGDRRYDLVLTDVVMPRMSGVEMLVEADRLNVLSGPVVVFTALGDPVWTNAAPGVVATVAKPSEPSELMAVVNDALGEIR